MTPFEIRLELVKLAKDMLSEKYHSERSILEQQWNNEVQAAITVSREPPHAPTLPKYFSENEVIAKATSLNDFISGNKQFL